MKDVVESLSPFRPPANHFVFYSKYGADLLNMSREVLPDTNEQTTLDKINV